LGRVFVAAELVGIGAPSAVWKRPRGDALVVEPSPADCHTNRFGGVVAAVIGLAARYRDRR
jgi:hypothetical protein